MAAIERITARLDNQDLSTRSEAKRSKAVFQDHERTQHELFIKEFKLPHEVEISFTEHDRQILRLLARAARRTSELFAVQENGDGWGNFYPPMRTRKEQIKTKKELEETAKIQPELLSPYTKVTKDEDGNLIAVPAHKLFKEQLKSLGIVDLLREAANLAGTGRERDNFLQAYLRAKATSLVNGNFKRSEKIWLEREDEPTIDIVIGLYDTYTDRFLGIKYAWQAWVGVLDPETTEEAQRFLNAFLAWWQDETGNAAPKIKMRIDHTRIMSGQAAKYNWVGNSLPCQQNWRNEFGSKFTIFKPVFEDKFYQQKLPIFRKFIDPHKVQGITDSFIKAVALRKHIAHEISHSLVGGKDLQQRLQHHSAWIKELYCDLVALDGYRQLEGFSRRESEVAMAAVLAEGYLEYEDSNKRPEYHKASTVFVNYLLETGSVRIENGMFTWNDTQEIFEDIANFLPIVQNILENKGTKEARSLLNRFFIPRIYYDSNKTSLFLRL